MTIQECIEEVKKFKGNAEAKRMVLEILYGLRDSAVKRVE